jgi:hypothetical protein
VLFGGDAGHRLENVGVVRGALFDGPVLHRTGDGVCDGRVKRRALPDCLLEGLEDHLGQARPLDLFVEDVHAVQVLDVRLFEVDAVEVVPGQRDIADRLLANSGHVVNSLERKGLPRNGASAYQEQIKGKPVGHPVRDGRSRGTDRHFPTTNRLPEETTGRAPKRPSDGLKQMPCEVVTAAISQEVLRAD